jgi:hypothetical protein
MSESIEAIVQNVVPDGRHGAFAVVTAEGIEGSITFSLLEAVWKEETWPDQGTYVLLNQLQRKRSGWRAMYARFLRPSDQQSAQGNDSKEQ